MRNHIRKNIQYFSVLVFFVQYFGLIFGFSIKVFDDFCSVFFGGGHAEYSSDGYDNFDSATPGSETSWCNIHL